MREHILAALRLKVEGKCSGRYGYTIAVTNMEDPGEGKLHEDTGIYKAQCSILFIQYYHLK